MGSKTVFKLFLLNLELCALSVWLSIGCLFSVVKITRLYKIHVPSQLQSGQMEKPTPNQIDSVGEKKNACNKESSKNKMLVKSCKNILSLGMHQPHKTSYTKLHLMFHAISTFNSLN
jgi:hypothetical protein